MSLEEVTRSQQKEQKGRVRDGRRRTPSGGDYSGTSGLRAYVPVAIGPDTREVAQHTAPLREFIRERIKASGNPHGYTENQLLREATLQASALHTRASEALITHGITIPNHMALRAGIINLTNPVRPYDHESSRPDAGRDPVRNHNSLRNGGGIPRQRPRPI